MSMFGTSARYEFFITIVFLKVGIGQKLDMWILSVYIGDQNIVIFIQFKVIWKLEFREGNQHLSEWVQTHWMDRMALHVSFIMWTFIPGGICIFYICYVKYLYPCFVTCSFQFTYYPEQVFP